MNRPLIRSYLLCALSRHSPLGSESIVGAIDLVAANTFQSLKRPTSSRRSNLQNQSAFPWLPTSRIHWSGTVAFDDHDGTRFAKVREGLAKVLLRRGISVAWVWCRECKAHTDIVHCHLLFHCLPSIALVAKLDEMKAALERLVDRHGDGIWGEFAVKLKVWRDPDGLYLHQRRWSRRMEAVSHQEEMARGARHHSRQAVRHLAEPRPRSSSQLTTTTGN